MKRIFSIFMVVVIFAFVACKNDETNNDASSENDSTEVVDNQEKVKSYSDMKIITEEVEAKKMISMRAVVSMQEIGNEMGRMYGTLIEYATEKGYKMVGVPVAIYHEWSFTDNDIECGLPVEGEIEAKDDILVSETYAGKVVSTTHYGAYDKMQKTWQGIMDYVKDNKLEQNGVPWEEYISDPATETDTSKWETKVYIPIK